MQTEEDVIPVTISGTNAVYVGTTALFLDWIQHQLVWHWNDVRKRLRIRDIQFPCKTMVRIVCETKGAERDTFFDLSLRSDEPYAFYAAMQEFCAVPIYRFIRDRKLLGSPIKLL